MKITNIETFIVDAGWRPWMFVKVDTDEGITGWGECSDGRSPHGIEGTIRDMKPLLIGKDPRAFEMRFQDMYRITRQSPGGIAAKAIAGLDCAFIDIKAKALAYRSLSYSGGRPGNRCACTGPTAAARGSDTTTYSALLPSTPGRL